MTDAATSSKGEISANAETISRLSEVPRLFKTGLRQLLKIKTGTMDVALPDGRVLHFKGEEAGPHGRLEVQDYAIVRKVLAGGDVGFGEAYMDGLWTSPDLAGVLEVFSANLDRMDGVAEGGPVTRFVHWMIHRLRPNTKSGARKNIEAHYDLGNDFYELWLDASMTYSSARFNEPEQSLESAQREKYAALARSINLKRDDHVLEIGCGWGGFAEYAAGEIGAKVTCLTLSPSQRDYAIERLERKQLIGQVDIKLQDYRDETGRYDAVASIEMFEAVGEEYWPSFFSKVSDVLKPGGKAGLQIITIRDDLFDVYRKRADFIQRYIFPGGILPSVSLLQEQFENVGLKQVGADMFRRDYAETLNRWMERFKDAWGEIQPMGFDVRFKRMWEFYLAYCEAGFRTGRIDVGQFAVEKP
ncbi:cyclopropane-fatty-acyl-phospholipid synthase [Marinicauda pacifica]|uniref:Class I SAM-dependent methyltransferase n=1 Tax=Marinicauda pacifica TaxID=1133559 RepID=A0A4S2HET5_9PROT|nr:MULTISPECIES: cyclopropane-fatty-acyl-phospholipid synthase family protein [Marinicauda]TGY94536.1 class I SAM-dependent methyltransferase [Marinicauda pacifica]GGE36662.1 cyclopropane-fatty-acyl-phospholipid synthase [Marinicauda pacifica]